MAEQRVTKEQLEEIVSKLDNKDFGLYFFTLDTKGNPTAGVANIYEHVKTLNELGYKAYILHEGTDYRLYGDENGSGISDWLGKEYAELPHISIESQLNIGPQDFIVIPEIFANYMQQFAKQQLPSKRVILSQNYAYALELLPLGRRWTDFGISDVITTSEKQGNYIKSLFPSISTHVVPVSIPEYFKNSDKPKMPKISILTREQHLTTKIIKQFYLQYPLYKWVTFKDMRNMSRENFAEELSTSCLAVWVDDMAGFGTFPVEAMKCKTPVIGKMPDMIPEWMEEDNPEKEGEKVIANNGVWTNTTLNIPELIATYMKVWLEDNVPANLGEGIDKMEDRYTEEEQKESIEKTYALLVDKRKDEFNNVMKQVEELEASEEKK
jgi:hypothetical protein